MAYESGSENIKVSKFNSTLAILIRIDFLWQRANNAAIAGKLMNWNWVLDRIWCELSVDANEDDEKKLELLNKEIKPAVKIEDKNKLYKDLLKKEIFLRKLQNKQGKGIAYEDSIDDYMDM